MESPDIVVKISEDDGGVIYELINNTKGDDRQKLLLHQSIESEMLLCALDARDSGHLIYVSTFCSFVGLSDTIEIKFKKDFNNKPIDKVLDQYNSSERVKIILA